jgi:twitching motility protein PilT
LGKKYKAEKRFNAQLRNWGNYKSQSDSFESTDDDTEDTITTVVEKREHSLNFPDGFDEEDFRETVEVQLPETLTTIKKETRPQTVNQSPKEQESQLTNKLDELIADREEIFRRVSMSIGESQVALRNSDYSLKEVRTLKTETRKLLDEMKEQYEYFTNNVTGRLQDVERIERFEKICTELSDRLSKLEDLSEHLDRKHSETDEIFRSLKEELIILKNTNNDTADKAENALKKGMELKDKIFQVITKLEEAIQDRIDNLKIQLVEARNKEMQDIQNVMEQLKSSFDKKIDSANDQYKSLESTLTENLLNLEERLKGIRMEMGEKIHDINEQLGFNFVKRMSALESHLEMTGREILPTIEEMRKNYDEKLLKLQETIDKQKKEIDRLAFSLGESLDFDNIIMKRLDLADARIQKNEADLQAEIQKITNSIKEQMNNIETSQLQTRESIKKLFESEKSNEKYRNISENLLERIRKMSTTITDILKDQIVKIEKTLDSLPDRIEDNVNRKLAPMEDQLRDLSGDLDYKLKPIQQEVDLAKSFIEEEMIKVKESWNKLDETISSSEGAMELAIIARESLEKLDREIKEAMMNLDGLMTSIRENTLKTDANSDKINLTIKMVDDARDRIKGIRIPSVTALDGVILTQTDINEEPDLSDVKYVLDDLLSVMIKHKASDLHLKTGAPPTVRLDGELVPIGSELLTDDDCKKLILSSMTPPYRKLLASRQEVDYAYSTRDSRFRVNAFLQKQSISAAFRLLWSEIPSIEQLNLPVVLKELCSHNHGLILVTGPAGSGKSTTLASMINYINQTQKKHVVTVEDPIEFIHRDNLSIITQREVGSDTESFGIALKQSLRQDPNVILIGEMRDPETIMTAAIAAETGHLVMSTLHTINTIQAVSRIIDVFSGDVQNQFRMLLASTLRGIISQRLLTRTDGKGRIPAVEVLVATPTVTSLILEERTGEIYDLIKHGEISGMQTFTKSLLNLYQRGLINKEDALYHADHPTEFRMAIEGHTSGAISAEDDESLMSWV